MEIDQRLKILRSYLTITKAQSYHGKRLDLIWPIFENELHSNYNEPPLYTNNLKAIWDYFYKYDGNKKLEYEIFNYVQSEFVKELTAAIDYFENKKIKPTN